jgi:hypothetical protein
MSFLKKFQDVHIYEKFKIKMSSNLIENAFESSLFHTFEQ